MKTTVRYPKKNPFFIHYFLLSVFSAAFITSCQKDFNVANEVPAASDSRLNFTKTAQVSPAVQTARAGVVVSPHIFGFYEYLPKGYSSDTTQQKYPLLICMHGIGQVGNGTTDLPGLLLYGPAMLINKGTFPATFTVDNKTYSMIIITPQLNDIGMFPEDIDSLIEYCKKNYQVDTNRVYLAGVSIGGACVWHYAGFSPATAAKITAMVPICAWTTPQYNYEVMPQEAKNVAAANIKIWQTHCYEDPTAMFSWSVGQANLVDSALPTPNPLPKLTCFNSNSHDAWTTTYDPKYKEGGMNIYQWMLHYTKNTIAAPIAQKIPVSQVVTLKAFNGLYAHNNGDGYTPLTASSNVFSQWEGFVVNSLSGGKIALQNKGFFVTKINPASVSCTATSISSNETFTWIFNSDASVSLKGANNKYLSCDSSGLISCKAALIGANEKFLINR